MKKSIVQANKDLDMRRYGKNYFSKAQQEAEEKGYAEGSVVTADDITPELLSNPYILAKINNWGLSNLDAQNLHSLTLYPDAFEKAIEQDEDFMYLGIVDICDLDGRQVDDNDKQFAFDRLSESKDYEYILLNEAVVLKRIYNHQTSVIFSAFDERITVQFHSGGGISGWITIFIGVDTL